MPFLKKFSHFSSALIFGYLTVVSSPAGARPSELASEQAVCVSGVLADRPESPSSVERARRRFYSKMKVKYPDFDPDELSLKSQGETDSNGHQYFTTVLRYEGKRIAVAEYSVNKTTMAFDVDVEPEFSGLGAYSYLLSQAVANHPETQEIPARTQYADSAIAQAFFHASFGEGSSFAASATALAGELKANVRKNNFAPNVELRNHLIRAANSSLAIQARSSSEFNDLAKIIVDPRTWEVSFSVKRGPPKSGHPQVIIRDPALLQSDPASVFQVDANGEVSVLNASALGLPGYDEMRSAADHDRPGELKSKTRPSR